MNPPSPSSHRALKCGIPWFCLFSLSLLFVPVASDLVNVSIDDYFGDSTTGLVPEYLPDNGMWHVGSPTEDCPACHIQPSMLDLSQIYNQTWHDRTSYPSGAPAMITIQFTGSAVYVFNILPNTITNRTVTYANISFSIDGEDATIFTHTPNLSSIILYNQLVYHNAALSHGPHTLTMAAAGTSSLILFDYLLYTTLSNDSEDTTPTSILSSTSPPSSFNTPTSTSTSTTPHSGSSQSPSSSHSIPRGVIVGAVIGVIALLLSVTLGAFLFRRWRARSKHSQMQDGHKKTHRAHRSSSEDERRGTGGSVQVSAAPVAEPEPPVRSLDGASAVNLPGPASDIPGQGTHRRPSSPFADTGSSSTATWTAHHVDLVRRLETLQRARSVPSIEPSAGRTPLGVNNRDEGVEMVIQGLEAEIAALRCGLAALRAQLADEPLPAYAE